MKAPAEGSEDVFMVPRAAVAQVQHVAASTPGSGGRARGMRVTALVGGCCAAAGGCTGGCASKIHQKQGPPAKLEQLAATNPRHRPSAQPKQPPLPRAHTPT